MSIAVSTCQDGVMNGNETDVDCGGSCLLSKKCDDGLRCNNGPDCISGVCQSNTCQGEYGVLWCKLFDLVSRSSHLQRWDPKR